MTHRTNPIVVVHIVDLDISRMYSCNPMVELDKISFSEYLPKKYINSTNFPINYEILSNPSTLMYKIKVQKIPYQDLIIDFNITHKRKNIYFDWVFYDDNFFELLYVCPKS